MNWKTPFLLARDTFYQAMADNVPMLAAGIAFYSLVSLAPILIVAIGVAGLVFGASAAEGEVLVRLRDVMGAEGAAVVQGLLQRTDRPGSNITAMVVGGAILFFGAARLFIALRFSLNTIWGVEVREGRGYLGMVRDRVMAFLMVIATGFLLLLSLIVSAAMAAVTTHFGDLLPGGDMGWRVAEFLVNFALTVVVFGLVLQVVPDVQLAWRDVWVGAVITALLFAIGRYVLSSYLGGGSFSVYGAAGSLVILLFWMYYSAQILCLGTEFTKLYVTRYGSDVDLRRRVVYEHARPKS